jgi:predicted NAD-dependent protein-ADP-ribosyltransferase YbiA (DUF1768 family)
LEYVTAEQYMMAGKARLFGDKDMEAAIIKTTDPKKQKSLGRKVRPLVYLLNPRLILGN